MNFPRHILDGRIRIIHADEMLFIWSAGWLWWHSIHFLNINGHEATWLSIEVFFLLQRVTGNSLSLLLLLPRIHIWSWGKLSRSPSSPTWCPECNFWVGNWLWIGRCVSIIEPSNAQVLHTHTHTHPSGTTSRWNKLQNHLLSQVKGLFENLMKPMSFLSRIGGKNYSSDCIHHFRGCENFWNSQSGDSEPAASVFSGNLLEILHPQSLLNQKLCCGNKPSRYFWWIFKFGNTPEQWFSKLPPY